jgi:hypothetical protein
MFRRLIPSFTIFLLLGGLATAQGLNTTASKDDWEEINFEFNSSVLTDGYPSLLRLADLLSKHPGYKVKLDGHTDYIGSEKFNEKLGLARATTVKSFLEKYGAKANQIEVVTRGKSAPKADNKEKLGRWINRRVMLTVLDDQGRVVSAGGVGDAIRAVAPVPAMADPKCCDEILRKLDKLDEILALLKDLKNENAKLRADVDALKAKAAPPPAPPAPLPAPLTRSDVEQAAQTVIDRNALKKISILGLNAGPTSDGSLTFSGKGRFFSPFRQRFAVQAEGEYLYFRDRQEGQFDLGLVNRWKNLQVGLFSSFKNVNIRQFSNGGTLGQAAFTADYLFKYGRVGLFGTKGFLNNAVVNRTAISRNVFDETYLRIVDQIGGSGTVGLFKNSYMEANLGYLKSYAGNSKPGGTIRLIAPLNEYFAFTVEGGFNETLLMRGSTGRVAFGFQLGNLLRPKEFQASENPVPADIPRIRYEMLTRRVRTGNDAPIADAGPDQIGAPAGTITLDGSASYDPDGDPITYQWVQTGGPTISLSAPTAARTTFAAAEGVAYAFRLTVKDDKGLAGAAKVQVTTQSSPRVRILRFSATPQSVPAGETTTLSWQVENAETVEISGLGRVDPQGGTSRVIVRETTQYRLTARNRTSEANETVTVTVQRPQVRILSFRATPATITTGDSSTLSWETENATEVNITGIGNVRPTGTSVVSPKETAQYTITARNQYGTVSSALTVTVNPKETGGGGGAFVLPRIKRFTASPLDILNTEKSTLTWEVEGADTVEISGLGAVQASGSQQVNPQTNTLYTLTARNQSGEVNSTVGVNVSQAVTLTGCSATPSSIKAGNTSALNFVAANATRIDIKDFGQVPGAPVIVRPAQTTTYTVVATGTRSTASCQITVTVQDDGTKPPEPGGKPPVAVVPQGTITTLSRQLTLDGSGSSDPEGGALTYLWKTINQTAAVLDATKPVTRVQLGEQFGIYIFELTVTNSKGLSSKATVTVNFVSTTVQ